MIGLQYLVLEDRPNRGLSKGDIVTVPVTNRQVWKARHWARELKREEYAVSGPAEYAATRTAGPKPLGSGWYELADGRKVRGRAAAAEAAQDRDSGDST